MWSDKLISAAQKENIPTTIEKVSAINVKGDLDIKYWMIFLIWKIRRTKNQRCMEFEPSKPAKNVPDLHTPYA